jgi:hypothetical protein
MNKKQKAARERERIRMFIHNLQAEIAEGFSDRPWASKEEQQTIAETQLGYALAHLEKLSSEIASDIASCQRGRPISEEKRAALRLNLQKAREKKARNKLLQEIDCQ